MWRRRASEKPVSNGSAFGVGVQVGVTGDPDWPDDPSGIIVGTGGGSFAGWATTGQNVERRWLVQFDEPQTNTAGIGAHERGSVRERYLRPAPPVPE